MTKKEKYDAMNLVFEDGVIEGTYWYNGLHDMYLQLGKITKEDISEVFGRKLFHDWYMDRLSIVKVDEYRTLIWYKDDSRDIAVDDEGKIYRGMKEIADQINILVAR